MTLIFDTSIVIELDSRVSVTAKKVAMLEQSYPELPKVSFMTYFEFLYGLRKKQTSKKENSRAFIENFEILQTTKKTANVLALLKEKYGDLALADLFIAAQAIENNMLLVTKDKDFKRIDELDKIIVES